MPHGRAARWLVDHCIALRGNQSRADPFPLINSRPTPAISSRLTYGWLLPGRPALPATRSGSRGWLNNNASAFLASLEIKWMTWARRMLSRQLHPAAMVYARDVRMGLNWSLFVFAVFVNYLLQVTL